MTRIDLVLGSSAMSSDCRFTIDEKCSLCGQNLKGYVAVDGDTRNEHGVIFFEGEICLCREEDYLKNPIFRNAVWRIGSIYDYMAMFEKEAKNEKR